jgi:hypothetical protein
VELVQGTYEHKQALEGLVVEVRGKRYVCSWMRPLQDQDSSSFSARENEVKSNLIAITEITRETNKALKEKDVQDCS